MRALPNVHDFAGLVGFALRVGFGLSANHVNAAASVARFPGIGNPAFRMA
jgi:hypothetical protein